MGFSVGDVRAPWWLEAPASAMVKAAKTGAVLTVGVGLKVAEAPLHALESGAKAVEAPLHALESGAHAAADGLALLQPGPETTLREELAALVDPHAERSQRRVALHDDRATVEVRGLASSKSAAVARALAKKLDRRGDVRWWRVNAVTGRVVAALADGAEDLPELLEAIEEVEAETHVDDLDWSRTVEYPADREPLLAAGIQVAGDICAIALSTAGAVLPLRGPAGMLRSVASVVDTQPRLRRQLEHRLGRTRADLLLSIANAVGNAFGTQASEGVANLVADTAQRSFTLAEAVARHLQWQQWEPALSRRPAAAVSDPLPPYTRPGTLPQGPVERVADEAATGSTVGAVAAALGGRGLSGSADILALGAPKAARAGREVFAATVSTALSRDGVLTLHPAMWRRLDRLSALVIDGEALLTSRRMVLDAEGGDEWPAARVWSAAQRLLWASADEPDARQSKLRLVHPGTGTRDRGATLRPVWRELREGDHTVGRVLVGRELDRRAHAVLSEARNAGLRVILVGGQDAAELCALADEFISNGVSLSKLVQGLQQDGHAVAVLSPRAHKAMFWADVAIGLVSRDNGEAQVPWSADVVCRELTQVHRVLAAITPARQVSERGRSLALSACALGGLLLVAAPGAAGRLSPMTAAQYTGVLNGALTGWRVARMRPPAVLAPLLPWHALEPGEVLSRLPDPGPVEERPEPGGQGRIGALTPLVPMTSFLHHLRRELADPLTPILGVGAVATAILGAPSDAVLLSSVLAVNAVVSARQRQRAEGALHRLLEGEQLTGRLVGRDAVQNFDGGENVVPADRLAVGDLLLVRAGDVVPADARLLRVEDLEVDESGLTGESVTVSKRTAATPGAVLGERACMVFEGSTVVNGTGLAVVVAVGDDTQAGRATAGAMPPEKGGVQAQLRQLTDRALPLTLAGGGVVTVLGMLRGRLLRTAIADGVAVAVAAVPEGLPLVATVAQLAAARRLSRHGVLVRASRTVEALGRVDTLCFDKTGTLTEGRLRLVTVADLNEQWNPDADADDARRLLRAAARACPDPAEGPVVHATDRAVLEAAEILGDDAHKWDPIEEIPFESNRGYAAALGHTTHRLRLVVKGAPEVVLRRCTRVRQGEPVPLTDEIRERAERVIQDLARQGLRVLVVARRDLSETPADMEGAVGELTLLGFLGLADTPRPQTYPLVNALQRNGISVRMITGDHPATAAAVAEQLGIEVGSVATGADLNRLDESAQADLIERSTVFARVDPEQKVRIVAALRRAGHVVGMTGDGANDAAAIRTADVGIGMAAHGSAAARNAADLVLTRPDPLALLHALVEGRGMWQRVTDAVGVLVGGNAGEVAFTLYGTGVSGQAPLGTRQFLLVNMLTDMFPAMALALSPDGTGLDPDTADDPQAQAEQRAAQLAEIPPAQLGSDLLRTLAVRGIATATGASIAWTLGRYTGTKRRAETIGLVALIGTQLGQTLISGRHSPLVWLTIAASGAVLGAVVMTPGLCHYFGCTPLGPVGWTIATSSAVAATAGAAVLPRLLPASLNPAEG
ncbi:cation-translocating P-type ATPase [Nocardia iowensis]|uniref:Cation-translocating P-type ATPase n=1 Tax=Nocardia iowensis TaxID=204891 RepID=A0ABX8RHT9_NOCIO|nr:cation-translocating P-type ATPase [Nocardia iowensis]QXN88916.1 cation-translocating P-type ATPase [Nocardia iowensis]